MRGLGYRPGPAGSLAVTTGRPRPGVQPPERGLTTSPARRQCRYSDAPTSATASKGPWRILIADRDPADPKWIIATVASPDDVRPASRFVRRDGAVDEPTAAWVASLTGAHPAFTPMPGALAWRVDEE